jgi:hypothetical protein
MATSDAAFGGSSATSVTVSNSNGASTGGSATTGTSSSTLAGGAASSSDTTMSATSSSTTDTTGSGGATTTDGVDTSTTGAGGTGQGNEACPSEAPLPDTPCGAIAQLCAYEDCDGPGRSVARCTSGAWSVESSACDGAGAMCLESFGGGRCEVGQLCLILAGGALLQQCVPNTCENGPVSCACIPGCSGECTVIGDASLGITISCNTCPSGLCP